MRNAVGQRRFAACFVGAVARGSREATVHTTHTPPHLRLAGPHRQGAEVCGRRPRDDRRRLLALARAGAGAAEARPLQRLHANGGL
eukprot:634151-Prymnesium_polylepis.2